MVLWETRTVNLQREQKKEIRARHFYFIIDNILFHAYSAVSFFSKSQHSIQVFITLKKHKGQFPRKESHWWI